MESFTSDSWGSTETIEVVLSYGRTQHESTGNAISDSSCRADTLSPLRSQDGILILSIHEKIGISTN